MRRGKRLGSANRRSARRTGVFMLGLLCGPVILAVMFAHDRHPTPGTLTAALGIGIALATLYVGWATYLDNRRDKAEPGDLSLADVADQLADRVRDQWEAEVTMRRLNDPYPLPIRWVPADAPLADDWDALVRLAKSGAGWPRSPGPWPTGPGVLAGKDNQLADKLSLVPTGRLVVLGPPGAGKTMLMVRLVLDLLQPTRRTSGGPVPVLVSVASWNPGQQKLDKWLAARLAIDYPGLAAAAPPSCNGNTCLDALLDEGLILPILDGLDELPDAVRSLAIVRIKDSLRPGGRLIVTCRTDAFRKAVRPPGHAKVALRAAAVELCPLDAKAVASYLERGADDAARWNSVLAKIPVARALSSPLMVGLAQVIYNPHPGGREGKLPDPAKDLGCLDDEAAIKDHLSDAFIPAAYRPEAERRRWSADQAERWLVFLAKHMDQRPVGSKDLAWWLLRCATPSPLIGLAAGLGTAAVGGTLGGLGAVGHTGGLAIALMAGLAVGLTIRLGKFEDKFAAGDAARHIPRLFHRFKGKLAAGLTVGVAGGLIGGVAGAFLSRHAGGVTGGVTDGVAVGLWAGGTCGLVGGFAGGLVGGFAGGLLGVLSGGVAGGVADGIAVGVAVGVAAGVAGPFVPARALRWSPEGLMFGLVCAIGGGVIAGHAFGILDGIAFGICGGLAAAIAGGLAGAPADPKAPAAPGMVLARDRTTFQVIGIVAWVVAGLVVGLVTWHAGGLVHGLMAGLGLGLGAGLGAGFVQAAWGHFVIARCWLALWGHLPWQLMGFLADAHQRGVLRQEGAYYQFRHVELQHRLASRGEAGARDRPVPLKASQVAVDPPRNTTSSA
jgi:NACHT domain